MHAAWNNPYHLCPKYDENGHANCKMFARLIRSVMKWLRKYALEDAKISGTAVFGDIREITEKLEIFISFQLKTYNRCDRILHHSDANIAGEEEEPNHQLFIETSPSCLVVNLTHRSLFLHCPDNPPDAIDANGCPDYMHGQ